LNNDRRKRKRDVEIKLQKMVDDLSLINIDAEIIKDEERDAYDNLSENLQNSEKGYTLEENADKLEDACSSLEDAIFSMKDALDSFKEVE